MSAHSVSERSTHLSAGVVVLLAAILAWLVSAVALTESTTWPIAAVVAVTSGFALLVGAVSRAISSGVVRGGPGVVGRAAVAIAIGVVVGELAAVVVFSGSVDRLLDERAARTAESSFAASQAAADLDQSRTARRGLDEAVEQAVQRRQEALVVARCEFNPRPDCPQITITGLPGAGPETRTANDFLADAQRTLDATLAERDRQAAVLDSQIADGERAVAQARQAAIADADRGLGARWVAMNDHTLADAGALVMRLLVDGFFVLLSLLPLILKLWRGETSQDRGIAADVERDRAELHADTAIAVKRAEVRAAIDTMWAEQQLASARMAVEAQLEIDREQQRRRVIDAIEPPLPARSERIAEVEDVYLPIAAEAEAASLQPTELPAAPAVVDVPDNDARSVERSGRPLIPAIPDVTRAAARWIRPLVPPILVNAIDTTTKPLRGMRQIFEETEEIHISMRRTHRVSSHIEEAEEVERAAEGTAPWGATTVERDDRGQEYDSLAGSSTRELREHRGPRELPPGG
ncbi:DUF4407 domain-containing protein [Mycolicibacterium gadium]|uniref:DUF4407 domain-containing protein n=1 Tax=Mycolicibacterium gadium TaxID=1794 RepID=A0ABT6GIY9_MYCGU|nr:DUF4407 domain-containing protein [Mycolicibacterium gadium]MDG5481325.1 DUF4407 domain-containing protein [Mycolicibacterium gadium]